MHWKTTMMIDDEMALIVAVCVYAWYKIQVTYWKYDVFYCDNFRFACICHLTCRGCMFLGATVGVLSKTISFIIFVQR